MKQAANFSKERSTPLGARDRVKVSDELFDFGIVLVTPRAFFGK